MSIFHPARMTCTACGAATAVQRNASVNADRRPDLRAAILDGTFQAAPCTHCGAILRLDPHLTYMDLAHGLWIAAAAASEQQTWQALEPQTRAVFDRSFGTEAPASGRALGDGIAPRLVFGWPALREKLVCSELGLDDVAVEMLKMAVIANVDDAPIADQTELRLMSGDPETLRFTWIVTATEARLTSLAVPRDLYDEVAADEDWQPVRARFAGTLLVDLRRFLLGDALPQAAE